MKAGQFLLAALTLAALAPLRAQDAAVDFAAAPSPPTTSPSNVWPEVTCTTNDGAACADALQMATDTRDALSRVLKLGPHWRFPVRIHVITADDPLAGRIDHRAAQVLLTDNNTSMTIDAYVPINDPDAREFIQRQYVTAMLWERFFAKQKSFDQNTPLDIVPLWLIEGLREWINEDPTHNREQIAQRALENQTAPTLREVTGWKELSSDRLDGLWQRAFSFYLVDSLVRDRTRLEDFQQWLDSFSSPGNSGELHFPTEANWQKELASAANRSRNILYTWEETSSELDADRNMSYAESKDARVQTCSIDKAAAQQRTPAFLQAVQERINVLTALELRAHPGWHSTLEAYRGGLTVLMSEDHADVAPRLLAEAGALHDAELASHGKLIDYINWFEVTHDFGPVPSHYERYFATSKQLEAAEADPTHPNPIRADLLKIESHL